MNGPNASQSQAAFTAALLSAGRYLFATSLALLLLVLLRFPCNAMSLSHVLAFAFGLWLAMRVRWDEAFFKIFAASHSEPNPSQANDEPITALFDAWLAQTRRSSPLPPRPLPPRPMALRAAGARRLLLCQAGCLAVQVATLLYLWAWQTPRP